MQAIELLPSCTKPSISCLFIRTDSVSVKFDENILFILQTFRGMWAILLQICCLVQWARGILGTEMPLSNSGLNSVPYVGSMIITADFSNNDIKDLHYSSLSDAIDLTVRLQSVSGNMIICDVLM